MKEQRRQRGRSSPCCLHHSVMMLISRCFMIQYRKYIRTSTPQVLKRSHRMFEGIQRDRCIALCLIGTTKLFKQIDLSRWTNRFDNPAKTYSANYMAAYIESLIILHQKSTQPPSLDEKTLSLITRCIKCTYQNMQPLLA